jgi:hypothetical protein
VTKDLLEIVSNALRIQADILKGIDLNNSPVRIWIACIG